MLFSLEMGNLPACSYFDVCGGCSYQNYAYEDQLEIKRKLVEVALSDFSPISVEKVIPSPKPYHYRHMIALSVKRRKGELKFGFMGKNKRDFVPVLSCSIADERLNQYMPEAFNRLLELPEKRRFHTSQMVLRVGTTGDVVTSLRADGKKILECDINGNFFSYSVSSFFQHNFSVLPSLIKAIENLLKPDERSVLFDLYSGVGVFGISFAKLYSQVFGLEEGYESVERAKENAHKNNITNIFFEQVKVEIGLPSLLEKFLKTGVYAHVIIDPPRVGLKPEVIKMLCGQQMKIKRLLYVSCSLEALARDLRVLTERFRIEAVQPVDLFPQTKHVETLVLLIPKD